MNFESFFIVFIGNLTFDTNEDDLKKFFEDTSKNLVFFDL